MPNFETFLPNASLNYMRILDTIHQAKMVRPIFCGDRISHRQITFAGICSLSQHTAFHVSDKLRHVKMLDKQMQIGKTCRTVMTHHDVVDIGF